MRLSEIEVGEHVFGVLLNDGVAQLDDLGVGFLSVSLFDLPKQLRNLFTFHLYKQAIRGRACRRGC